ncbi:MAG TPA: peptidoglycan-binding protein [Clostridia bacterium]|nr:peptidoglycan-binding protein [Clostridia bacterium]
MFIPKSKKYVKACAAVGLSAMMFFSTPSLSSAAVQLRLGSSGNEVQKVQSQLKDLGFFKYPSITGYYGTITRDAVIKFQAAKGISQDGVVGTTTRKYLFTTGTSESGGAANASNPVLRKGSRGAAVTRLQELLKAKGYYKNGSIDGSFGGITYSAVIAFQKGSGLQVDGVAGPMTWAALLSEGSSPKGSGSSGITSTGALKRGSKGGAVTDLQKVLKDLGYLSGKVDGSFGPQTERDVKAFQKANGLVVDGKAGPKTMARLNDIIAKGQGSTSDRGSEGKPTPPISGAVNELLAWADVDKLWPRNSYATITDFDTGKTFKVMRSGGYNHADVETATAADTEIYKEIYGGVYSWNRRAIVVSVNGRTIAASMAGMPHAGRDDKPNRAMVYDRSCDYGYGQNLDAVKGNNMDGVFDVHFYKSKTHATNKVDDKHQAQVKRAAGK